MAKIDLGKVIGDDFKYEDFTQEQLEELKVKGDAGDNKVIVSKDGVETREDLTLKKEGKFTTLLTGDMQETHKLLVDDVLTEDGSPIMNTVNQLSNPNLLINGDFQIAQRGDTFDYSSSTVSKRLYTFDRWSIGGGSKNFKITYENGCRIQNTLAGSYFELANICENNLKVGDVVTLSLNIKSNKDFTMRQRIGAGSGASNTDIDIKQGTHIYTLTSSIKAESVTINQIGVFALFGYADTLFDITVEWAKLELGTIATPFVPRIYAEELAICKRYFKILYYDLSSYNNHSEGSGANTSRQTINFDIDMRIAPTVSVEAASVAGNVSYVSVVTIRKVMIAVQFTNSLAGSFFAYNIPIILDAEIY